MGVGLRRRYGYQHGVLTAYEDEDLASGGPDDEYSAILEAEIERPRVGPMRDIVATIQPEQDVIVRADVSRSIAVQGAPGTGKTAVGLHRAAYLLYAHREQLRRQGVLVVGPNESFLRYIRDVLPALGEVEAGQTTIEALVAKSLAALNARWTIRGHDDAAVATLKGDARLAEVLARAVWAHVGTPTGGAGGAAGRPAVPGGGVRDRGDPRRPAHPRGEVRRRARDAAPGARPPDPGEDGARRRLPRRPGAERRGAQQAGQGVRRGAVAGGRAGQGGAPAAVRRRRTRGRRRRDPQRRRAGGAALGAAEGLARHDRLVAGRRRPPRRGDRPGRAHAVARATSWSTRRRTSRR